MTEVVYCKKHGFSPIEGIHCFACKEEERMAAITKNTGLRELDVVRLKKTLLSAGSTGTIVNVWAKGAYEVEFIQENGSSHVLTLSLNEIEKVEEEHG